MVLMAGVYSPRCRCAAESLVGKEQQGGGEDCQHEAHHEIARRYAGHRLSGCAEVVETRGVELEMPEGIEARIGYEGQAEGY